MCKCICTPWRDAGPSEKSGDNFVKFFPSSCGTRMELRVVAANTFIHYLSSLYSVFSTLKNTAYSLFIIYCFFNFMFVILCLFTVCVPRRPAEGARSSGTGVTGG